jgi:hypothetical protein
MNQRNVLLLGWREIAPWLAAAITALLLGLLGSALYDLVDELLIRRVEIVVFGGLFALSAIWLYRQRLAFLRPRTRGFRKRDPEPRQHLVLFLSALETKGVSLVEGVPKGIDLSHNLQADLKTLEKYKETNPPWRWEMPLRGLLPHKASLQTVTVVTSPESLKQLRWFCAIVQRYLQPSIKHRALVRRNDRPEFVPLAADLVFPDDCSGWKFEDFEDLSSAMQYFIQQMRASGARDAEIIIDFTGGQKVTSVVAAAATFNTRIEAQYVQTGPPWDVLSYDMILGSNEAPGF